MTLLSTAQSYLTSGQEYLSPLAKSVQSYIPAPISALVSTVASVALNKYSLFVMGALTTAYGIKKHTNFLTHFSLYKEETTIKDTAGEDKVIPSHLKTVKEHRDDFKITKPVAFKKISFVALALFATSAFVALRK